MQLKYNYAQAATCTCTCSSDTSMFVYCTYISDLVVSEVKVLERVYFLHTYM